MEWLLDRSIIVHTLIFLAHVVICSYAQLIAMAIYSGNSEACKVNPHGHDAVAVTASELNVNASNFQQQPRRTRSKNRGGSVPSNFFHGRNL